MRAKEPASNSLDKYGKSTLQKGSGIDERGMSSKNLNSHDRFMNSLKNPGLKSYAEYVIF
ncbi:MAG: hypothetical protein RBR28_09735 [Lentimicrobium sp.]|jgi:hypothetical protein|nr:hypothetical protein [Lentimicrobium sp.]